jgi:hypothetical protein
MIDLYTAAVLLTACAPPTGTTAASGPPAPADAAPVERTMRVDWIMAHAGFTLCQNEVVVSFVRGGLTEIERLDVEAHEQMHREQHERAGSCQAFRLLYGTPRGTLELEAEAYSAGLCVAVLHGSDEAELRRRYVETVHAILGSGTLLMTVSQEFARHSPCVLPPRGYR